MEKKRNTIQRQIILEAVKALDIHASAEQVYDYVIQRHPNISKATVYRNLNQTVESGELINIGDFGNAARYDHNCHKHYHLMCEKCKRIFDVEGDYSGIINRIPQTGGFDITGFHLTFSGLCRDCKDSKREVN